MSYDGNTTPNIGTDSGADLTTDIQLDVLQAYERKTRFADLIRIDNIGEGAAAGSFIVEGKEDRDDGAITEYQAGTRVNVSNGTQDEIIVPLDRPQYESRRIDKWKQAVARYDTIAMNVRQLGTRLANAIDRKLSAGVYASSQATGLVANGDGTTILNAGIVLHDICKIFEFDSYEGSGYTVKGKLIGHITMGASLIESVAKELGYQDEEETMLLEHIIISHHYYGNFGSPRKPNIAEALIVHFIDNIDSKTTVLGEELNLIEVGHLTGSIGVLERERYYKHKLSKD